MWQYLTMAMSFSFKYGIDIKNYKNEDWMLEYKWKLAQLAHSNCQEMRSDSSNRMMLLAASGLKTEEDHLNM